MLYNKNASEKERSPPFLPAHSMSKLRTLSGAILCQSPSAGWLIKSVHPTSTSYWHKDAWRTKAGGESSWTLLVKARQNSFYLKALRGKRTADPCSVIAICLTDRPDCVMQQVRCELDLPCLGTENPCPPCSSLHALCTCLWEAQSSSIPPHHCPP